MSEIVSKEEAGEKVKELIETFKNNIAQYKQTTYNISENEIKKL